MANKNILFITEFYLPTIGGSITTYANVYPRYSAKTIWVLTQKVPTAPSKEVRDNIQIHRVFFPQYYYWKPRMILSYLWCIWLALRLIKKNAISEIHCDQVVPAGLIGWLVGRLKKIPYFVYAWGEEIGIGTQFPFRKKWMKKIYREANGVFACSYYTVSLLKELDVPEENIGVIFLGIPNEMISFKPNKVELQRKYHVENKRVLLTVSRIIQRKGHYFVLKALRDLISEFPDVHYLIAGEGEDKDYVMQVVKDYSLHDSVSFLGSVVGKPLWELYSICDLFIMPNIILENGEVEGFGIVFLEAGAMKKPVIGGNSGGTSDAIVDGVTGYIVNPMDSKELKERIKELLKNSELCQRMGEAAHKRISDYFVWNKVYDRIQTFRTQQLGRSNVSF